MTPRPVQSTLAITILLFHRVISLQASYRFNKRMHAQAYLFADVAQLAGNNCIQLSQPAAGVAHYVHVATVRNRGRSSGLTKYKRLQSKKPRILDSFKL